MNSLEVDLARIVGTGSLRLGEDQEPYTHDSTELEGLRGSPDAVVVPPNLEAAAEVVAWCYRRGIAIVPRGGGTGFSGGAVPVGGGVVCSLEAISSVRSFAPEYWRAHVDAGITTGRVHQLARDHGLFYPPDPGASEQSQIGGNIACNAGGPHSFKYGVTRAWVTGLEAVIAEGEIVAFGGPVRKDAAGYDMVGLLVGSEGTLGLITGAWLRFIPAPEKETTIVAGYRDMETGVAAIMRLMQSGVVPATIEYFDSGCIAATRASFPGGLADDIGFLILTELDGFESEVDRAVSEVIKALQDDALEVREAKARSNRAALLRWRNGVSFAVSAQRGGKMSEDVAVPLDRLAESIEETISLGLRHGVPSCSWGHAGDGNLHATFMIDKTSDADLKAAASAAADLFSFVARVGGTLSGEHGLGWTKRGQFARHFSPEAVRLQMGIKKVFDPRGLFNPGKKIGVVAD